MGAHVGSHIQKIRQRNTAETPLVILIKKTTQNQKVKKMLKKCALNVPQICSAHRPYFKIDLAMLWYCENYYVFEQNRAFWSGSKTGSSYG
jgi:hypothetical protein